MKSIIFSIIFSAAIIGGAVWFSRADNSARPAGNSAVGAPEISAPNDNSNVSVADGKQIIEISARGGYSPRMMVARAGVPTVLKIKTANTFDCSSFLVIPALNYRKNLPPSGETEIEIPAQPAGSILQGTCAMGMYGFKIQFED